MTNFYEQICETFIRPSRQTYNIFDLGTAQINVFTGQPITQNGKRTDFQVYNNRQDKILCSQYINNCNTKEEGMCICVVYLHSLNGSRLQSACYAESILARGFNFCCFDFSGTGMSQGKYVSLGYHEKYDIQAVLNYISTKFNIKKFVLWGRSMGAAAAIKFLSLHYSNPSPQYQISSLVLDSPFHSLSQITLKLAKQKIAIPELFLKAILLIIQSSIQKKANFKISQMQLLQNMKQIRCPVLFLTSKQDKLVDCSHSQKLYNMVNHRNKQIIYVRGQHNCGRDFQTIEEILGFIGKYAGGSNGNISGNISGNINGNNNKKGVLGAGNGELMGGNRSQVTVSTGINNNKSINSKNISPNKNSRQQILSKSSKQLKKIQNNLIRSLAIGYKSSTKLESNSPQNYHNNSTNHQNIAQNISNNNKIIKIQTCGDQEPTMIRYQDQQFHNNNHFNSNNNYQKIYKNNQLQQYQKQSKILKQYKKSLFIYSPKMSTIKSNNLHQKSTINNNNVQDNSIHNQNFTEKKFSLVQQQILKNNDQKYYFQSDKKVNQVGHHHQPHCIQLNKSPLKQPPKIVKTKPKYVNDSTISSKTPQKPSYKISYSPNCKHIVLQKKTLQKSNEVSNFNQHPHANSFPFQIQHQQQAHTSITQQFSSNNNNNTIQINHFNIINQKLRKKRRKQQPRDLSPQFNHHVPSAFLSNNNNNRNISISIQKQSQIPYKTPSQFLKQKSLHQSQLRDRNY